MIIDLQKFISKEQPVWEELEKLLRRLEDDPLVTLSLKEATRFHYLYERTASDLVSLNTFAFDPDTRRSIESLVARAYAVIHDLREKPRRFSFFGWFFKTFPRVFRRRWRAFALAFIAVMLGAALGGGLIKADTGLRQILLPFPHLHGDPSERVEREERVSTDRLEGGKATFSSTLMTHNTRVSVFSMALGMTWGIGTLLLLFYNGVILGAVCADYIMAGETLFLMGWLLPHGAVEIPAFIIAGQAGLVLAQALIGYGDRNPIGRRLRAQAGDLATLIGAAAILLVWAGIVEAFLSQYHEPLIPYALKITLGMAELLLLSIFLMFGGRHWPRMAGKARRL